MSTFKSNQSGIAHLGAILVVIVIAGVGFVGWKVWQAQQDKKTSTESSATTVSESQGTSKLTSKISVVEEGKLVLPNGYADPTVVSTDSGYRMYVNRQSGGPSGYLTFTSSDGVTWQKETDMVIPGVSTGRAVKMDGGIRVYYPGPQPIKPADPPADMFSSFTTDGINFTKDSGVRLQPRSAEYYVEGPTVFELPDKTWRMYFNENSIAAGNNRDGEIWGATSKDGLAFTRDEKPTLQAGQEEAMQGNMPAPWKQVLHPFVIKNPKGGYLMFYNSHSEIYAAVSENGMDWKKIGKVGVHGADMDGYFQQDGTLRIYYGDFSPQTGGVVYSAVLKVD